MKHEETFLFPKCGFRREIAQDGESPTNSGPDQATNHYKIERSPSTWHKSLLPAFWPQCLSAQHPEKSSAFASLASPVEQQILNMIR
jgi:hypothetical protein